ncbi:hypothetical protein J6590_097456 [Homalodisca vitripennis]|nr:hypothetical protein J6590_097456 [Homalodisca vitripennis]
MWKRCFLEANDRYFLTGIQEDKLTVNACKKIYDPKLRNVRRKYSMNHNMTANNKSKAIWDIINSERNSNKALQPQIKSLVMEDKEVEDPMYIAQHVYHYFTTIAEESLRTVVGARNLFALPNSPVTGRNTTQNRQVLQRITVVSSHSPYQSVTFSRLISYTTENS